MRDQPGQEQGANEDEHDPAQLGQQVKEGVGTDLLEEGGGDRDPEQPDRQPHRDAGGLKQGVVPDRLGAGDDLLGQIDQAHQQEVAADRREHNQEHLDQPDAGIWRNLEIGLHNVHD